MSDVEPVDEPEEIKDFAYYAELAEYWLAEAERFRGGLLPNHFEHAMKGADVYSRLAAVVLPPNEPESVESRMIWRHADGCPCTAKG